MAADFYARSPQTLAAAGRARLNPRRAQLVVLAVKAQRADRFTPVACGFDAHPALHAAMDRFGARQLDFRSWLVDPLNVRLADMLAALPRNRMVAGADLRAAAPRRPHAQALCDVLNSLPTWRCSVSDLAPRGRQQFDTGVLVVSAARAKLKVSLLLPEPSPLFVDDRFADLGINRLAPAVSSPRPAALPAPLVAELCRRAWLRGVDVLDRSDPGVLSAIEELLRVPSMHVMPHTPGVLLDHRPDSRPDLLVVSYALAQQQLSADRAASRTPPLLQPRCARWLRVQSRVGRASAGLLAHQDEFVSRFTAAPSGLVCALPTGSGKTRAALFALAADAAACRSPWRAVVCVPAALRAQWEAELAVVGLPFVSLTSQRTVVPDAFRGVVLASFDLAASHPLVRSGRFSVLVVDEATVLFSRSSQRSAALFDLRARCGKAMALTATPDGRSKDALGRLACFVTGDDDLLGPTPLSRRRARAEDVLGPLLVTAQPPAAQPTLRVRSTSVDLAVGHLRFYQEALERLVGCVEAGARHHEVKAAFVALRKAACVDEGLAGEKLALVSRLVASRGQPVLVFSDFNDVAHAAAATMSAAGLRVEPLTSVLSLRRRQKLAERFQRRELDGLVVGPSGQVGLNLQAAAAVVHLDVPMSQAMFNQRNGRAARLASSHRQVDVLVPFAHGTHEQALFEALGKFEQPLSELVALVLRDRFPSAATEQGC